MKVDFYPARCSGYRFIICTHFYAGLCLNRLVAQFCVTVQMTWLNVLHIFSKGWQNVLRSEVVWFLWVEKEHDLELCSTLWYIERRWPSRRCCHETCRFSYESTLHASPWPLIWCCGQHVKNPEIPFTSLPWILVRLDFFQEHWHDGERVKVD